MFQVVGLPHTQYAHLFAMDDQALFNNGAEAVMADAFPAYPCRVSLDFARVGERLILLNHTHLDVQTPYHSRYAIYIREGVQAIDLPPNSLPPVFLRHSPIAVRAFGHDDRLKAAQIVDGPVAAPVFEAMLANEAIAFLHCHYAAYGCFAAKVIRA